MSIPLNNANDGDSSYARKWKRTLLTTLAALQEMGDDVGLRRGGSDQSPCLEGDKNVPAIDEHLQNVGAEAFNRFSSKLNELDKKLRDFGYSIHELGSSAGILSSVYGLRERLAVISHLFRVNAADLFPEKLAHKIMYVTRTPVLPTRGRARARNKPPPHVRRPFLVDPPEQEEFPDQINKLAQEVITFSQCLNEFPELIDEGVNASFAAFEGDLKYWASCLGAYQGRFRHPPVQRYLHDLTEDMGDHIESIIQGLDMVVESGVPIARLSQRGGANDLVNYTSLATFFSTVTATMLQFSFGTTGTSVADAVNGLWLTSLVFSIVAAVDGLLGLTWKQAMFRSPHNRVPWWVFVWIERSVLVFLVLSSACFSAGFVIFSYSSNQNWIVSTITALLTAFTGFGLTAVLIWFTLERYAFSRHQGSKWFLDMLADVWNEYRRPFEILSRHRILTEKKMMGTASEALGRAPSPSIPPSPSPPLPGHSRLRDLVRYIMRTKVVPAIPECARTSSRIHPPDHENTEHPLPFVGRVTALISQLRKPRTTEDLAAHTASVRHIQFSPNGKFLATTSRDRTSVIFQMGSPSLHHCTLPHPSGFVNQVEWSPSGKLLLTKLNRSIKVWTEAGVCTRTIERGTSVQSITWMPNGEAFLSVEGGGVTLLDLKGKNLDTFYLGRLKIHDVSVTPDGQRLLCVGMLLSSQDGLVSSKCRVEKQIISYNIGRKKVESRVPILHDVRDITVAKRGDYALVSYEFKAPPQLWRIEILRQRPDATERQASAAESKRMYTSRLSLYRTYMPKSRVDFHGPSYYGGQDDELVLSAGKAGDIHVWDRESGSLLHHLHTQDFGGGGLTCMAGNPAADPFMFATGYDNGIVRVWRTCSQETTAQTSVAESQG